MRERIVNYEREQRMLDVTGLCAYISMGRTKALEFAEQCGAKRKIGKRTLFDKRIIDKALDEMCE